MKKIFTLLILSVFTICVNAQMVVPYTHYEGRYNTYEPTAVFYTGNVGLSGGVTLPFDECRNGLFEILTEHGVTIANPNRKASVFVGLGTGLSWNFVKYDYHWYYDDSVTMLFLPIYLTTRVNFNHTSKVNPFIKVDFGYYGGLYEWEGSVINGTGDNLYSYNIMTGLETGVSFKINRNYNAISASVGYRAIIEPEYPSYSHQIKLSVRFEF